MTNFTINQVLHSITAVPAMRDWLCDCSFADVSPDEIAEMDDRTIMEAVERHFDGGLEGFLATL